VVLHHLPYRPPLAREALLGFLALRATPGVEEVDGDRYRRVLSIGGRTGVLAARLPAERDEVELELDDALGEALEPALAAGRRIFDVDAEPSSIDARLRADPRLRPLVDATPGLRVPGAPDGFEIVVRAIVGQQISVAAARTITGRLAAICGRHVQGAGGSLGVAFPRPEDMLAGSLDGLGMPETRRATLLAVARAIADGALDLSPAADRAEARARLLAIRGIGPWTADYVALRALGDPDAFLPSDLVLRQVAGSEGKPLSPRELELRARRWRPWRAYAVVHLWRSAAAVRRSRAGATRVPAARD
jgi:AraC family transcriptional regulator, regulatory protein of adaptative response / DNA-3-methyladenine glycosylase II